MGRVSELVSGFSMITSLLVFCCCVVLLGAYELTGDAVNDIKINVDTRRFVDGYNRERVFHVMKFHPSCSLVLQLFRFSSLYHPLTTPLYVMLINRGSMRSTRLLLGFQLMTDSLRQHLCRLKMLRFCNLGDLMSFDLE